MSLAAAVVRMMTEYKSTLLDRHGPAAMERMQALSYGAMVFVLTFGALALETGFSVWTFVCPPIVALLTASVAFGLGKAAGEGWHHIAMSGASTPYEEQFSYQQALVMQGKVTEALASFEEMIAAAPDAIEPRIRAAELYAQDRESARRAAELLRQAQRIPSIAPGRDIYATNRLVDLLAGPLRDPGRAVVELRKLIDRYPTSTAAAHARDAIARIKQEMLAADEMAGPR
ncbi:MAG TPA: hypothetical protein VJW73_00795 [Gemmatimonadaceae bacterium]|nr:hypothetical protein [Gemmatimonadaceae bacterium]